VRCVGCAEGSGGDSVQVDNLSLLVLHCSGFSERKVLVGW